MRIRHLVVSALLALPCALTAQVLRIPRRGGAPDPAPLPPPAEPVARALALQRSRWSVEGYSMISAIQVPSGNGGVSRYTTFGNGTHADYRYADHFTATMDMTAAYLGGVSETAEAGTRYTPLSWDSEIRPFFDVRGAFMNMSDAFYGASGVGASQNAAEGTRYSRGFGGVAGVGSEYTISSTMALTTEFMAMRNRMTTYRLTSTASLPAGAGFMLTSFRFVVGLKYNPLRSQNLTQTPR
jgi:hypothetical protein